MLQQGWYHLPCCVSLSHPALLFYPQVSRLQVPVSILGDVSCNSFLFKWLCFYLLLVKRQQTKHGEGGGGSLLLRDFAEDLGESGLCHSQHQALFGGAVGLITTYADLNWWLPKAFGFWGGSLGDLIHLM